MNAGGDTIEERIFEVAKEAARIGGDIIASYFDLPIGRRLKDDKTFVTDADTESEAAIVSHIKKQFPDHAILGEESGDDKVDSPYQWIIDPLDGTSNFLNGIPVFCVSVGVYAKGVPVVGVIYQPVGGALYSSLRGTGAFSDSKKIAVSKESADTGLITFGVGKGSTIKAVCTALFAASGDVFKTRRYFGSMAAELAFLARGGTEAAVSLGTKKWDHAGGLALLLEAGGTVTDFKGSSWKLGEEFFIASNGVCHQSALAMVQKTLI